jgi:heat shock protein HslJ
LREFGTVQNSSRSIPGLRLGLHFTVAVALLSLLSACVSQGSSDSSSLAGSRWQLLQIQSMNDEVFEPLGVEIYTLEFQADGRLLVRADCNRGQGSWQQEGSALTLGQVAVTRAMCRPQSLEARFLRELSAVRSFVLEDGNLYLATMADGAILEFGPAIGGAEVSARTPVVYDCDSDLRLQVNFLSRESGSAVELVAGDSRLTLSRQRAASGARYANGDTEFWERGAEASYSTPAGRQLCQRVSA